MSGIFDDEIEKVSLKLREAQLQTHQLDQDKQRFASELRIEKSANGKFRDQVDVLTRELEAARKKATDAQAQASLAGVLEIEVGQCRTDLATVEAKLAETAAALGVVEAKLSACGSELGQAKQVLRKREEEFAEAQRLLEAFRQARDAEAVISGSV